MNADDLAKPTCDWITLIRLRSGRASIGPCGQLAGRKFRVTPEPRRRANIVRVVNADGSGRTVSWRCAEHSPLRRRTRSPFRVTFVVETGAVVSVESVAGVR